MIKKTSDFFLNQIQIGNKLIKRKSLLKNRGKAKSFYAVKGRPSSGENVSGVPEMRVYGKHGLRGRQSLSSEDLMTIRT